MFLVLSHSYCLWILFATGSWQVFKVPFFDRGQLIGVFLRCGAIFLLFFINIWAICLEVVRLCVWQMATAFTAADVLQDYVGW